MESLVTGAPGEIVRKIVTLVEFGTVLAIASNLAMEEEIVMGLRYPQDLKLECAPSALV